MPTELLVARLESISLLLRKLCALRRLASSNSYTKEDTAAERVFAWAPCFLKLPRKRRMTEKPQGTSPKLHSTGPDHLLKAGIILRDDLDVSQTMTGAAL